MLTKFTDIILFRKILSDKHSKYNNEIREIKEDTERRLKEKDIELTEKDEKNRKDIELLKEKDRILKEKDDKLNILEISKELLEGFYKGTNQGENLLKLIDI